MPVLGTCKLEKAAIISETALIICNILYTLYICLSISEINMFKPNSFALDKFNHGVFSTEGQVTLRQIVQYSRHSNLSGI